MEFAHEKSNTLNITKKGRYLTTVKLGGPPPFTVNATTEIL